MKKYKTNNITGLTLFEMLVVVLVLSILSAIFIFSSRRVLITSKVSRVKEEHTVLVHALAKYQMDNNLIPANSQGLRALSISVKYLESIPNDPFTFPRNTEYSYMAEPATKYSYMIVSAGPDGYLDMAPFIDSILNPVIGPTPFISTDTLDEEFDNLRINLTYDPTNGIISKGDIITLIQKY